MKAKKLNWIRVFYRLEKRFNMDDIDAIFSWLFTLIIAAGLLFSAAYFNHIESLKVIAAKDPIAARCANSANNDFLICSQYLLTRKGN